MIDPVLYDFVLSKAARMVANLVKHAPAGVTQHLVVCAGRHCEANGEALTLVTALNDAIQRAGVANAQALAGTCIGICEQHHTVYLSTPQASTLYSNVTLNDVTSLVDHLQTGAPLTHLATKLAPQ